jgi:hypothetical protein
MGWEKRHGKLYYRKERIGNRVISQYVGCSETARLIGQFEQLRREQRAEQRAGNIGFVDIWVATRASATAPWGPPQNLGPNVNTAFSVTLGPYITPIDARSTSSRRSRAGWEDRTAVFQLLRPVRREARMSRRCALTARCVGSLSYMPGTPRSGF